MAAAGSGEGGRRGLGRQTAPRGRSGRLERRGPQPSGNWGRAAPENAVLGEKRFLAWAGSCVGSRQKSDSLRVRRAPCAAITASQPTRRSRSDAGSLMSPRTASTPGSPTRYEATADESASAAGGTALPELTSCLSNIRAQSPSATRRWTAARPTFPVAPVTATVSDAAGEKHARSASRARGRLGGDIVCMHCVLPRHTEAATAQQS